MRVLVHGKGSSPWTLVQSPRSAAMAASFPADSTLPPLEWPVFTFSVDRRGKTVSREFITASQLSEGWKPRFMTPEQVKEDCDLDSGEKLRGVGAIGDLRVNRTWRWFS